MSVLTRGRDYGGRSAKQRRAERRARLMAAGLELFGTEGYAATSIERLCAKASVSTRNFYEEFPGRETLLIALHEDVIRRALDATHNALSRAGDIPLAKRIALGIRSYLAVTVGDPQWTRIAYVEVVAVSPTVERHRLHWRDRTADLVVAEANRAVTRGEVPARDFRLPALAFVGAVQELAYYSSLHNWPQPGPLPDRAIPNRSVQSGQGRTACHRQITVDDLCAELTSLAMAALTAPAVMNAAG